MPTATSRWDDWFDSFEVFVEANYKEELQPKKKRVIFLHVAGIEIHQRLKCLQEDPSFADAYKRATSTISDFFRPRKNHRMERFKFVRMDQTSSESIDSFLARLRHQASCCQFTDTDDRLLDQIIVHCHSDQLRKKLLMEGEALTLNKALEIARTCESALQQSQVMSGMCNTARVEEKCEGVFQFNKKSIPNKEKRGLETVKSCIFCSVPKGLSNRHAVFAVVNRVKPRSNCCTVYMYMYMYIRYIKHYNVH
jgi:hypothetical protein